MLSYIEIARREERRAAVGVAEIALEHEPLLGGSMNYGGPGSWANQAMGIGIDQPATEADVDRFCAFYTARGCEPTAELCAFAEPSLLALMEARGFRLRAFENVLYRELSPDEDLRACLPWGWPEGLEIETVDPADDATVDTFIEVSSSGFRDPGEPLTPGQRRIFRNVVEHARCTSFLARVDGVAVGGGTAEVTPTTSAIFGVSVLPEYRRRGVQLALMVHRMQHAAKAGCPLVCIGSRPGIPTERNARRLGFALAYSKAVVALPGKGLARTP